MEEIFIQLALILVTAFVVSYIVRSFNQPIIIGYIIAGMIISPFILDTGASKEIIQIFSDFGIAFLLFIVGLHLNPKVIKEIGIGSLLIGLGQIFFTFTAGFLICYGLLGYSWIPSVYIAIALSFSSTIIIMKILSDKRQLDSLHGKMAIGILIVQDLAAILVLMVISSLSGGNDLGSYALQTFLTGGALLILLFLVGFLVFPKLTKKIAQSQELLFLFSICWCFSVAALFSYFGFSIEIGALIAGVILSISPYSTEISSKIRPLRDFFLIIFFIIIGLNIPVTNIGPIISNALILSILALIFKPLVIMSLMAIAGYTKRNNFLVGTSLAQISEFSLIVMSAGLILSPEYITQEVFSTVVLTLVITIVLSSYMIIYSKEFYKKTARFIKIFERKNIREQRKIDKQYDAILFGYNRIGFGILRSLKKLKKKYLVVDFNPDTIANMNKFRMPCLYGDTSDSELLEELPLDKIEIAVSTIPDFETNALLIESIRLVNPDAIIIVRAHQVKDALDLYKEGATYVLTPHFLGGEYVSKMIKVLKTKEKSYEKEKEKHVKMLTDILDKGFEHPEVSKD